MASAPAMPEHAAYLWGWYLEVRGPGVLTFAEIDAWARLTGRPVTGEEALVLRSLDNIYHNQQATTDGRRQ